MQTQEPQAQAHTAEDWFDPAFVAGWLARGGGQDRRHQFAKIRAQIPFRRDDAFRYLNLGAGPGGLDALLLSSFPHAEATLLDGSPVMLDAARQLLAPFGTRASFVQADLRHPGCCDAVRAPYDVAVSKSAIHNFFDGAQIRRLYATIFPVLADGGLFVNLDLVRLESPALGAMAKWAGRDPDAGLVGGGEAPGGTLAEQLGWLREAGFTAVDSYWRDYGSALFGGWRGRVRIPDVD
ncbi:MAG: tRNA (cmo5U34)-methyltransferase [Chloroflexota bacterium]|jgi:tRNA (cmo5U34)-methyltransferase|nr:tRNA (cmo5U34)-methyltransferase [Chloroflexota bacterium]